jgi:hypothetical protein
MSGGWLDNRSACKADLSKGAVMAIREEREGTVFCKVVHIENGKALVRRVHEIHVLASDGKQYVVWGEGLPTYIGLHSGRSHQGEHLGQVLLRPQSIFRRKPKSHLRDAAHIVLGMFFAIGVMNFFIAMNGYAQ